jgi:ubiquinone/menaquinone biosynthesis C-methylase UbiE
MPHRVCPWWLGYFLASPVRAWVDPPERLLASYIDEGMTVLEPGPGMGFYTLELARRAGAAGRVVAIDIQPKMLASLQRRARKAGLESRIETRLAAADSMNLGDLKGRVDFVLAASVVHELPSDAVFFREACDALKPGGTLLLAEPSGHVTNEAFGAELANAASAGLELAEQPEIKRYHTALLRKTEH